MESSSIHNILVTGANGQLGNEMRIIAKDSGQSYLFTDINEVEGAATTYLDVTDLEAIRNIVAEHNIDIIVNCAAYTNVEKAEDDPATASLLNTTAPDNLARVMSEVDGLLIHISTDYVFGGESYSAPCNEELKGAPTGVYGRTKLLGEQAIAAHQGHYVIIRTSWLYSEYGHNFCKTMMSLTAERSQIRVVADQIGTPTYALDLARAIEVVVARYDGTQSGIYHYSNDGECSWYDFARSIAELNGTSNCDIVPCTSEEYPSRVERPRYSVLDKTKIRSAFGVDVPNWADSLSRCISNIKSHAING